MDADTLRDRIAEIVNAALVAWNTDRDTRDSEGEYAARAIIDEFGLTVEDRLTAAPHGRTRNTSPPCSSQHATTRR